jgi:hypothetical protein
MSSVPTPCAATISLTLVVLVSPAPTTGLDRSRLGDSGNPVTAQRVNPDAQQAADFSNRVQLYLDTHRKLEGTLPPLPARPSPEQLDAHQRSLARLIGQARGRTKHGDVFGSEIRAYFRRQIARAMSGPDAAQLKDSIMDDNPGRIRLQVNGRYPDDVPLSTVPPPVLAALPKLPEELEYRFIGERLILLDIHAYLVVDYIDDALPR